MSKTRANALSQSALRYGYISQIAAGPLGSVWAARATNGPEQGRIVAVRRITVRGALRDFAERFATVAHAGTAIRHPRVSAVLDIVPTEDEVAVVTEYVEGEFLRSMQRRAGLGGEPFPEGVALRIVLDLCDAVRELAPMWHATTAHDAHPTLWGGLSPNSVLIATFGEPLVQDLGLSATAREHPLVVGHPEVVPYCAPEQVQATLVDERADVFTLGVLLWELLANRPLFGAPRWLRYPPADALGDNSAASLASLEAGALIRRRLLESRVARLDAVVRAGSRIDGAIADVVARAVLRDVQKRFATLGELSSALESLGSVIASREAVADFVHRIAATSIEARRAAIASVTGQSNTEPRASDSARPTLAPRPSDPKIDREILERGSASSGAPRGGFPPPRLSAAPREGPSAKHKPPLPTKTHRGRK